MVVPQEIIRHAAVLKVLARAKPNMLKKQIPQLPSPVIKTLQNISRNYLKGNIKLSKLQLKKIRHHKRLLRELALKKTSVARSRKLIQKGGFLSSILIPLVGLFASLFTKK